MSSLYELTDEYLQVLEMAEDPDIDPEVFSDTLEGLSGEIEIKADGYARIIASLEAQMDAIRVEENRLGARRKSLMNKVESMKRNLMSSMTVTGKTKFRTELFSFTIKKNPPAVVIDDKDKIPDEFWKKQEPVLDKAGIKDLLKTGETCDYAHLEQSESLLIR